MVKGATGLPRASQLLVSLEDERLVGMTAVDLGWLIEEYVRRVPRVREEGPCPSTWMRCTSWRVGRREVRALEDAKDAYPDAEAKLITLDPSPPNQEMPMGLEWTAASRWFLE